VLLGDQRTFQPGIMRALGEEGISTPETGKNLSSRSTDEATAGSSPVPNEPEERSAR